MRFTAEDETRVAAEFCRRVCADVMEVYGDNGAAVLGTIRSLNAAETDDLICHSHDYIDPNQSLLDALDACGFPDLDWSWENDATPEQCRTVEANVRFADIVWGIASSLGFDAELLTPPDRLGRSIELRTYGGLESGTISGRDMTDIADDPSWCASAVRRMGSGDVGQSPYDIGLALALAGF